MHALAQDQHTILLHASDLSINGGAPFGLALHAGEIVCLSGPSGAGKTLLLRTLADLDPHPGALMLRDQDSTLILPPQWRSRVAYLPAESHWWMARVGEHFQLQDSQWLEQLGFDTQVLQWEVRRCSTGERQRLALLRLLSHHPEVLLLDEPTANLDPDNVARIEQLLLSYRGQYAAGILWVSHDPVQIKRVADRQLRMAHGSLSEITL